MVNEITNSGATVKASVSDLAKEANNVVGFETPEYQEARKHRIDIIKSVSIWDSIDRYANTFALSMFSSSLMSQFLDGKNDSLKKIAEETGKTLSEVTKEASLNKKIATATFIAGITAVVTGVYAHYKKRMVLEPADITHREAYITAESQLLGNEIGNSIAENMKNQPAKATQKVTVSILKNPLTNQYSASTVTDEAPQTVAATTKNGWQDKLASAGHDCGADCISCQTPSR